MHKLVGAGLVLTAVFGCGPSATIESAPDATAAAGPDAATAAGPDAATVAAADAAAATRDAAGRADATIPDASPPADAGPVVVGRTHWKVSFEDEFRGKPGRPDDEYCYDVLKPQCHVWPGTSHNCDLSDVTGPGFFPPTKANLVAAIQTLDPAHDFAAMSEDDVKTLYGQIIGDRLAALDKCTWTFYEMVNWMATDYQGHWSARFDASQVEVDPSGKGYLKLSATYAPVDAHCVYGGNGGDPNCQVWAFAAGQLTPGVAYWADPDPRWPGVYYAPVSGDQCPYGGTFSGVNCFVIGFAPHFLEETGVAYWVDPDPRWPGVFYADQSYRCKDNIDYEPNLAFRQLTCPVLDGGLMSYGFSNRPWIDPAGGTSHDRGAMQMMGRFEAKARIPKGPGAFPATWLMPREGGWPYDGGEIDVLEARDNADEVYQTYHHGKCYLASSGQEIDATDSADCSRKGGTSTHLSKGFTVKQRQADEFWQRDHLFAVEWTANKLVYSVNNVRIGTIEVGTVGTIDSGAPPALAPFEASNFPTSPFYWILNHSTYVPPGLLPGWAQQTFLIDYVRNYVACGADNREYCPGGGVFHEDLGCVRGDGTTYASPCQPSDRPCVNGGTPAGARCQVYETAPGVLNPRVTYWADADPRWPGVYYHKVADMCPYGGSGTVNCQVIGLPGDLLEPGVAYVVDASSTPPGIYYLPDFR